MDKNILKKFLLLVITAIFVKNSFAVQNITFWHAMGGQLGETVNKIVSNYNNSQKTCKVNPFFKGSYEEAMTAAIAAFRAKKSPNIIQIFDAGAATIINAKGAIVPVSDLFAEAKVKFNKDDYISGVISFYSDSNGKMIGMPFNSSTPVLYYNKDALKKAGVKPPKTWEDFEKIAPKLKLAGYIGLSQSHTTWIFSENFHSRHNLPIANNGNGFDGSATKILYNNKDMIYHFKKLKEWKDKGYYGYYGAGWGENRTPFEKGDVAMWLGSSGSLGGLKKKVDFNFGATYLPYWNRITGGKEYNTFIGGAALFAFSGKTKSENACSADFFSYLSKPDTQVFWHKATGYVPITKAAFEKAKSEGYYKKEPAAEVGILQLSLPGGKNTKGYRLGFYANIREVMNREYDKIFNGSESVEDAFSNIEVKSNKLLDKFAKTIK